MALYYDNDPNNRESNFGIYHVFNAEWEKNFTVHSDYVVNYAPIGIDSTKSPRIKGVVIKSASKTELYSLDSGDSTQVDEGISIPIASI